MPIVAVRIPQIGEGLQEARLVAVLKQPGDRIKRDEPIYQMETDKAVMDVESPCEGTLVRWLAAPDDVLEIGAAVAEVSTGDSPEPEPEPSRAPSIPPRTRAYAKEKGISDEALATIEVSGSKLMPEDIDRYLATQQTGSAVADSHYVDAPVNPKQRVLASRLVRSSQSVVPGTITVVTDWSAIEAARARQKSNTDHFQPSAFTMLAYAVAQTLKEHPTFRSRLVGDATVRTYHSATLGIAVGLPGDELVTAVVDNADALAWREFAESMRQKIDLAREGQDQANESITVSLTNMQSFGLRDAVPVVVSPSVATLFIGEPYFAQDASREIPSIRRYCNLALTFDHRLINGVGAAKFINDIKRRVETISSLIDQP
jgi:pyruvate/2-oxoglutarate dehydrogenase complex dihydrolipoamide acyltransferase (E2) component